MAKSTSTEISRERNRIHARKTRQRKKEQMQTLQGKADALKAEQLRLRQIINEKNTARILVGLFSKSGGASPANGEDAGLNPSKAKQLPKEEEIAPEPGVEVLLQRPIEEIPDSSKIPELPALILPGQHASKKLKEGAAAVNVADHHRHAMNQLQLSQELHFPTFGNGAADAAALDADGIDYELLGKDRSKCTPAELDRIRRERNRMHAKRTRDRKRLFMEEMAELCRKLDEENGLLRRHLAMMDPDHSDALQMHGVNKRDDCETTVASGATESDSRSLSPANLGGSSPKLLPLAPKYVNFAEVSANPSVSPSGRHILPSSFQTLLEAAATTSDDDDDHVHHLVGQKRRRCVSTEDDDDNVRRSGAATPSSSCLTKKFRRSSPTAAASEWTINKNFTPPRETESSSSSGSTTTTMAVAAV